MYPNHTGRGKRNFRRVAGIVKIICGMNLVLKRYIHKDKVICWVAHHLTRQTGIDKELFFNIHNFTKSKSERDSAKLKSLLSVLPHERTVYEISLIQSLLHKNQAFHAMPNVVQLEICQATVYQQYEVKTTVLQKGHQPEACYFVVTGKLSAKSSNSNIENGFTEILNEIEEGDLFGDAALLTNTKRPCTILCKTNAELLLINKEDFKSILAGFLEHRYNVITDLLGSLPIFTSWTIEKLTLLSHSSLLRYYRSGTLVVPESCNSSFIVIVKSGSCNIVTKLRMNQCGNDQTQRSRTKTSTVPDLDKQFSISAGGSEQDMNIQQSAPLTPISIKSSTAVLIPVDVNDEPEEMEACKAKRIDESPSSRSVKSVPQIIFTFVEDDNEKQEKSTKPLGNNEDNEQDKERKKILPNPSQAYSRSTFVKIGTLEQGGIFGLTEIPGSTCKLQLSLISDGAECIFIPRKLFLSEASEKSRQAALELVDTYLNEQMIRENFTREQEWSLYKARLVRQLLDSHAKQSSFL